MEKMIQTMLGKVKGYNKNGVSYYLGLPYAKPPVEDRRFREPEEAESWKGIFNAVSLPPNPLQMSKSMRMSEDCLYLNIWVPEMELSKNKPLPVMVWIYGGSYSTGGIGKHGAMYTDYDGTQIAKDTGCIVVAVNYRLNVFGFLDFSGFNHHFARNLGLKDIISALKWIHKNIAAFGGDKDNVTLFGQSAGGALIAALLNIPDAQPYFHKSIVQSACLESFYTPEQAAQTAGKYLKLMGIREDEVQELCTLDTDSLLAPIKALTDDTRKKIIGICTFNPVVDGEFLIDFPTKGTYRKNGKPLLIGSNHEEARMFVVLNKEWQKDLLEKMLPFMNEEQRIKISGGYADFPGKDANSSLLTDSMYTVPKYRFADAYAKENEVYVYRFDYFAGLFQLMNLKSCHAEEVFLLFGKNKVFWGDRKRAAKIGYQMRRFWGAFAHTGNPNTKGMPQWERYIRSGDKTMVFDRSTEIREDPDGKTLQLYQQFGTIYLENH